MRKFIIDTDTASDDAFSLVMALRDPDVEVVAITTVAGNVPLETCTKNALISVEMARTYIPPVYEGISGPLFREKVVSAEDTHGSDGLGDVGYGDIIPALKKKKEHAVNAMIRIIEEDHDGLELIAIGPLTNVAAAICLAPETMKKLKMITIMGSAGLGFGNVSPLGEFNIWADAEAADVVFKSGIPLTVVGWDACLGDAVLSLDDIQEFLDTKSPSAEFCIKCNETLMQLNEKRFGERVIDLADPVAVAAATYPLCVKTYVNAFAAVELVGDNYGEVVVDHVGVSGNEPNCRFVTKMHSKQLKNYLKKTIV